MSRWSVYSRWISLPSLSFSSAAGCTDRSPCSIGTGNHETLEFFFRYAADFKIIDYLLCANYLQTGVYNLAEKCCLQTAWYNVLYCNIVYADWYDALIAVLCHLQKTLSCYMLSVYWFYIVRSIIISCFMGILILAVMY